MHCSRVHVRRGQVLGISACMWRIPLPLTDNVAFLLEVQQVPLADVLRQRLLAHQLFPSVPVGRLKLLLSASNGELFLTFRGFHVVQMALTALSSPHVPGRPAAALGAFSIALMALSACTR